MAVTSYHISGYAYHMFYVFKCNLFEKQKSYRRIEKS